MLYPTAFFTNNHVSLHIYKNKFPMKILYYIYQICIALPIRAKYGHNSSVFFC